MSEARLEKPKAVVLMSGGMDSCVAAAIAQDEGFQIHGLHASYGQRTEKKELEAFQAQADFFGLAGRLRVDLGYFSRIGGSSLIDPGLDVPEGAPQNTEIPNTYVPFRNAHFVSIATSWAEAIGAGRIFIGAVSEDSSGYPDCRPEYYEAMNRLIAVGTRPETHIRVATPLIELRKFEIVRKGIELGAPLDRTWSCYRSQDLACGTCDSCRLRLEAFSRAGSADPIAYRKRSDYAKV